jgi:hypothetical protein
MALIALELSDAGIMAAAGDPARRIPVDGEALESPGYILPIKKKLSVGKAAEGKAHLYPRQIQHRFWDQLSTSPLKQPESWADSFAEMAHTHLSTIWQSIKPYGSTVLITLPGYYTRDQMGLLLGIAQDLKMTVRGIISQAVAACPHPFATPWLLYVDAHLHRTEVSLLEQGDRLRLLKTLTLDKGLRSIHRSWIEAIAQAFVAATRYDPLHTAASEQSLYDQLPEVLQALVDKPATPVQARADHAVHHISLGRETLTLQAEAYYDRIGGLIHSLMEEHQQAGASATVLLAHRLRPFPGLTTRLRHRLQVDIVTLPPGAAAKNTLTFWDRLERSTGEAGAFFFKQRPWSNASPIVPPHQPASAAAEVHPTHLLCRDIAYAFDQTRLSIVQSGTGPESRLEVLRPDQAGGGIICTVGLEGNQAVLSVAGSRNIYVDEQPAAGRMVLALGQTLTTDETQDPIRLITCL